jgi:anti-sigma factor RsiW
MSETRCTHIQELLPAHVEGAIAPEEAQAVRAHLAECPGCRAEAERWERLEGLLNVHLRSIEPVEEPAVEALLTRLRAERPVWRIAPEPVRFWRRWAPGAALAAAAVLLAGYAPRISVDGARDALLDEAAAVAATSRELPRVAPGEAAALYAEAATWPRTAADRARRQWSEGLGLAQAVTRRIGVAPLATCLLLLVAANLLVARGIRDAPRSLQGG